ncbi:MAG: iron ABC transporter permease [Betaproteobacteria bacterium]
MNNRLPTLTLAALALLIALALIAFSIGRFSISPGDLLTIVWAKLSGGAHTLPATYDAVIFQIRGPRVLAAILIGAALSGAGAVYQNMFRNPLVSPDILGVSSGAALGAVLAIFLALPILAIQGFAFAGGLLAVALVYFIGNTVRGHDPILALILTGVVVGTMFGSGIALMKYLADPYNQLPAITFWLLGSLSSISTSDLWVAVPMVLLGLVPIFLLRWRMNLLSLSDDEARALGVNVARLRLIVVICATLMTAAAVAISGIIGWIGLLIPHAARLLVGPEFARLLPLSLVLGACFLLAVDTLARTMASIEMPPGVLTALIGTPLFLWLLAVTHARERGAA